LFAHYFQAAPLVAALGVAEAAPAAEE
jgi:hypothetical protein